MEFFLNSEGQVIIRDIISAVRENKDYLTRIDGEVGDGDHGINMNKGFTVAGERIGADASFSDASKILSQVLMMEIGGSMGPLYGTFFKRIARETKDLEKINAEIFQKMLDAALSGVKEMGGAVAGDKTIVDTLEPAATAFRQANEGNLGFKSCLNETALSARKGCDSTKDMVARIGRSARLGERSRGVLDAGAVSCCIILETMCSSVIKILRTS